MATIYCWTHMIDHDLGTMCPECRREQAHATQQALLDAQRDSQDESLRQHEDRLQAIREAEYKRFNPGSYTCDACKLTTLLSGASRCPVCHADVAPEYWPAEFTKEKRASEAAAAARKKAEEAAIAATKKVENVRKRACDAAVATVKLGLTHTEQMWEEAFQEAKKKRAAQGFLSRLVAPLPPPAKKRKYRFQISQSSASNGRWTTQPVLILGIVTLDANVRLGFKHYRFATPFEYIAVFRYLKTMGEWDTTGVDQAITSFQRWLDQDWPTGEPRTPSGDDVTQDYTEALHRHRERAAQGDAASQREYGRMHAAGHGVSQDFEEALKWYHKAAALGDTVATRSIGRMYANAQAVSQDYGEALKWYRKAAAEGDAVATRLIGFMYANGQVVSQDYGEALKWYRKAADQGDAWAQRNIGQIYHKGHGVVQDNQEALKWYAKAAEQGDAEVRFDAQFNIDLINGNFDK